MIEPLTEEQVRMLAAVPLSQIELQELSLRNVTVLGIPITRLVAEVVRLRDLRSAAVRYDEAIRRAAREGRSWTTSPELDRLYEEWIALCGEPFEPSVSWPLDPGRLLSDEEIDAAEAVVRAAIRWTEVAGPTKVASSFDLLMADLRRLRGRRQETPKPGCQTEPMGLGLRWCYTHGQSAAICASALPGGGE